MHTLTFTVSGTVTQQIEWLNDDYAVEDAELLFEEGTFLTRTWFDFSSKAFVPAITTHDGQLVARIHRQTVDGEYEDFELGAK